MHLFQSAISTPKAPAICIGTRVFKTYQEMADRVWRLGSGLRNRLGLEPGTRVAIIAKNNPYYLEALYGIWHAGLVAVPVNAKLHKDEFAYILDDVGAELCFTSSDLSETVSAAAQGNAKTIELASNDYDSLLDSIPADPIARGPNDLAWIFYTSGTTGRPKGAMLTNRNLAMMSACCLLDVDTKRPWKSLLHAAPMSHGSGLYAIPYILKGGQHIIPESAGFDVEEIYDLISHWPNVAFFAAPTMVKRLSSFPKERDTNNLKTILYGGGPMHVEDSIEALDRFGPKLAQLYGQGESPMTITALALSDHANRDHPKWRDRLGSVGRPQSFVEVMVADQDDTPLPAGEPGEILVRGDTVMSGYWNQPGASEATLRGGWLHTGDVGVFDTDGFLTLKDRSKDLIISGGHNIYPREVEEILLMHPNISEIAIIGKSDPEWGETVVACIVTKDGADVSKAELDAFCVDRMARFKRPREYRFLPALPKNNYGKVLKKDLR